MRKSDLHEIFQILCKVSPVEEKMDEDLLRRLKEFGMGEYEAKIYSALFYLKFGTAREINEITGVPRGKVYQTLDTLIEKRFVLPAGGEPMRYQLVDVAETFERVKKEQTDRVDQLSSYLQSLDRERPQRLVQAYEIRTPWAIESRVQLMLRQVRSEMLVICNDPAFLKKYAADLIRLSGKIHLYVLVREPAMAEGLRLKCYLGGPLLDKMFGRFTVPADRSLDIQCILYADTHDSLVIFEEDGTTEALFCSHDPFSEFLYLAMMRDMKPV